MAKGGAHVHVFVHFRKLRFSTMRYALVALRYVVTGIVAPLLALLLVLLLAELAAAIDAASSAQPAASLVVRF